MTKLWQNSRTKLRKEVEEFVTGSDYLLDQRMLLKYDVMASIAHAQMLQKIGILTAAEHKKLEQELKNILKLAEEGKFHITAEAEDSHTALENYLVQRLGEVGKKIHTARSRNDQVLAALRLYMRHELNTVAAAAKNLIQVLQKTAANYRNVPLPGYTHMQRAMPSSVSLWLGAFEESLADDIILLAAARKLINQNPLGTGAGYGLPIKVDRELTTQLLKFEKIQSNPIYVQNSRPKFELLVLQSLQQIMLDLNKLATDMILFSTAEFGFIALPEEFCTGSSIMPQKKNPDVLELVRGSYSILAGCAAQVAMLAASLPSGYNRDHQLTKESLWKGFETTKNSLQVMSLVVAEMKFNKERCRAAMTEELFTTKKVYELVQKGVPFRDAYRIVKEKL